VQEVGIEYLSIEFPNKQYGGHGFWAGYFAIYFEQVVNSWVRHVTITDADRNLEFEAGGYNTATHVTLGTKWRVPAGNPTGAGTTGHYGVSFLGRTQDNLVTESELRTVFDHNLAVGNLANGNVYAGILSQTGRLDHHGAAPFENLYTELVLRKTGSDLFLSGGNRADEPNAGRHTTLWNVVKLGGTFPGGYRPDKFAQLNVIGVEAGATKKTATQEWIERWPGPLTTPPNLYEAQLKRRRGY
jgi:hypothetical protein